MKGGLKAAAIQIKSVKEVYLCVCVCMCVW
jgi:hypothetical protein